MRGSRIHNVVRELENENIDVIQWTENTSLLISRALSPAKISSVKLDEDNKRASVYLPQPDEVSKAIGRGGLNIKLASRLVGWELDVFREIAPNEIEIDDVDLKEFSDEIDGWVLSEFRKIGLDTAKAVLELERAELVRRTELEEETIAEVLTILEREFEQED
jgi:N utilization substance protein A